MRSDGLTISERRKMWRATAEAKAKRAAYDRSRSVDRSAKIQLDLYFVQCLRDALGLAPYPDTVKR